MNDHCLCYFRRHVQMYCLAGFFTIDPPQPESDCINISESERVLSTAGSSRHGNCDKAQRCLGYIKVICQQNMLMHKWIIHICETSRTRNPLVLMIYDYAQQSTPRAEHTPHMSPMAYDECHNTNLDGIIRWKHWHIKNSKNQLSLASIILRLF